MAGTRGHQADDEDMRHRRHVTAIADTHRPPPARIGHRRHASAIAGTHRTPPTAYLLREPGRAGTQKQKDRPRQELADAGVARAEL